MIRFLIIVFVALVLGASGAYYLHADAGYVQVAWQHWVVQTSLLGFVLAVVFGFGAVYYGAKLLVAGVQLPSMLREAMDERRSRRARVSFEAGLQQLLEGRWRKAEVELIRRAADHPTPGLNYLLAARAATELGADDRVQRYLEQAKETLPVASSLARAQLAATKADLSGARQILLPLLAQDPQHERVVEDLAAVHERAHDWDALDLLLAAPETARALPAPRLQDWRARTAQGRIEAAIAQGRLDQLKKAWDAAPASLRSRPELRRVYAAGLAKLNADAEAAAQIASGLRDQWDSALVDLYGSLDGVDAVTQLATAEQWLGQHGEKPELLWLAARACRRNKLWGKARSYLEGLVRIAPSAKAYLELAQICQQMQAPDDAARYYRLGLEQAASSTPLATL